jgi:hypothetical protein
MLWAALVAGGVAVVSMAIFGARLTRRPEEIQPDDLAPPVDPDDPWAAWRPRPFEDHDRPPRPRLWPVLASLTGLVLVGGGLAGARQSFNQPEALASDTTPQPFILQVKATPTPTPFSTPSPKPTAPPPKPTAKTQVAAASSASTPSVGPVLTGSASCSALKARVSYDITARGANLSWVGVYLDGKVIGGGPISSTHYGGSSERTTTAGTHALEVSTQDKAGKSARKQWQVHCS